MNEYPLKFQNFIDICKNFGILYHKAFYSAVSSSLENKNNKINVLKNRLTSMMNEYIHSDQNIMKYNYDYMLDGVNHFAYNIPSSTIVIIQNTDILIYDIFADVFYFIYEKQLYLNNHPFVPNKIITPFHGNLQNDSLQFIYYYMGYMNNIEFTNKKLLELITLYKN